MFNILDSILKFSSKKFSFAVYLVEIDTDRDRQAVDVDPDSAE
jgi:hypothetical protein